jgi:hypothetical protein
MYLVAKIFQCSVQREVVLCLLRITPPLGVIFKNTPREEGTSKASFKATPQRGRVNRERVTTANSQQHQFFTMLVGVGTPSSSADLLAQDFRPSRLPRNERSLFFAAGLLACF